MAHCLLFGVLTFPRFRKFNQVNFRLRQMAGIGRRCKPQGPKLQEKFQITPQSCTMTNCMCMEDAKVAATAMRICTVLTLKISDGNKMNSRVKFLNQEMSTLETYTKTP